MHLSVGYREAAVCKECQVANALAGVPRLRPRSLRDSQREQAGRALVAMFAENNNSNHRK